jgi:K+-sensing histidine kinase KdpD
LETYASVLACVTQQRDCDSLIREAARLTAPGGSLEVLHVSSRTFNFFENIREGEALEYLFVTAKSFSAELTIINALQIPETVAQFAEHRQTRCIVIGSSRTDGNRRFGERLTELLADSDIHIVTLQVEA